MFCNFAKILQNSQENACVRVSFLINLQHEACDFIKKELLTQVFPCEFCEIFENSFFIEYPRWLLLHWLLVCHIWWKFFKDRVPQFFQFNLNCFCNKGHNLYQLIIEKNNSTQLTFTCSKSATETLEKDVKCVQS